VLLAGCVAVAAVLTYVLPAGEYERRQRKTTDPASAMPLGMATSV